MKKLPKRYLKFMEEFPEVGAAYRALGDATGAAGPLDTKTRALVSLGVAVGMRHEGAVRSHVRKSVEAGATRDEIRHALILSTTTLGFPNMMAALSWADDVMSEEG